MLHEPALTHYTQEDNKDNYVNKQSNSNCNFIQPCPYKLLKTNDFLVKSYLNLGKSKE